MLQKNILFERVQPNVGGKMFAVKVLKLPALEILEFPKYCSILTDDLQMPKLSASNMPRVMR